MLDNWNTLGMRGTASNDIVLEDVFVPDERVLANRPHGVIDPPLQVIGSIAFPIISRCLPRRRRGGLRGRRRARCARGPTTRRSGARSA